MDVKRETAKVSRPQQMPEFVFLDEGEWERLVAACEAHVKPAPSLLHTRRPPPPPSSGDLCHGTANALKPSTSPLSSPAAAAVLPPPPCCGRLRRRRRPLICTSKFALP